MRARWNLFKLQLSTRYVEEMDSHQLSTRYVEEMDSHQFELHTFSAINVSCKITIAYIKELRHHARGRGGPYAQTPNQKPRRKNTSPRPRRNAAASPRNNPRQNAETQKTTQHPIVSLTQNQP
jgi:hypothetical protein